MKYLNLERIFLLLGISFLPILASPSWYYNHENKKDYELIAYGVDEDLELARQSAKAELAKSIQVNISSSVRINKRQEDQNFNKNINSSTLTTTNLNLSGIKIQKEELFDGKWYVKVSYDNRAIIQKIISEKNYFKKYKTHKKSNIKFYNNINNSLGFNVEPKLFRKNFSWYLQIGSKSYVLSKDDFLNFFSNKINKNLDFSLNKYNFKYPDEMIFKINSNKKGFVSILYAQDNGKVGVLAKNLSIDKKLIYPPLKSDDAFIVYNTTKTTLQEQYVAIFSKEKLRLTEFEEISESDLDESNYNYDKLILLLNNNVYSSINIKIKPNR